MRSSADRGAPDRLVVTGASGFLGSNLVRRAAHGGVAVTAIVRRGSDLWRLRPLASDVRIVETDLAAPDGALAGAIGRGDVVVHLAAAGVVPGRLPDADVVRTNVLGTLTALQAAHAGGATRFVYCGSCFEYPDGEGLSEDTLPAPATEYAASKTAGGVVAQAFSRRTALPVVWMRPFMVYGPFEDPARVVPSVVRAALGGEPIALTAGAQLRDFVFVDDVVDALIVGATHDAAPGGIFNICTGVGTSIRTLVETIVDLVGAGDPRFGAIPYRANELWRQSGDPSRTAEVLGWRAPTSLRDGLGRAAEWARLADAEPVAP